MSRIIESRARAAGVFSKQEATWARYILAITLTSTLPSGAVELAYKALK
jgi:hypothetical protein